MKQQNNVKKIVTKYLVVEATYSIGISLFVATLYLYMQSIGYTLSNINQYIALFWVTSVVFEIPSGTLSDVFGRRNATIISSVIRGAGLLVIGLSAKSTTSLILSGFFTAIGSSLYSGSMSSWVVDEISKYDSGYNLNKIFSWSSILGTTSSMVAGYLGAQILGTISLALPTIVSGIELILTAVLIFVIIDNDKPESKTMRFYGFCKEYISVFKYSFSFLRNDPRIVWTGAVFINTAIITTAPYNQWQIYFQDESKGIISGYIYVLMSVAALIGAFLVSKVKIKNSMKFFFGSNIVTGVSIILSTIINNLYLSIVFFLFHVLMAAANEVSRFSYLNKLLSSENRTTLLSVYYSAEAIVVALVMYINGLSSATYGIGNSWIILVAIGMLSMLLCSIPLRNEVTINA